MTIDMGRCYLACFLMLFPLGAMGQLNVYLEAGKGVTFHNHIATERVDDFTFKSFPVQMSLVSLSGRINRLGIRFYGETQDWSQFYFRFNTLEREGTRYLRRTFRLGAAVLYFLNIGSERFEPFGGVSFERIFFAPAVKQTGAGHPLGYFPTNNPDYRAMVTLSDNGYSGSVLFGSYYNLSRKFAVVLQARYSAWLSKEPIANYDVRYHSDDLSYEFEIKDSGRILFLTTGIRLSINGKNF